MGSSQLENQQGLYNTITTDVVFDHISCQLLQKEIIDSEEYQRVKAKVTDREQMAVLIDILKLKDSKYFNEFVNILRVDYKWIADELENNNKDFQTIVPSKASRLSTAVTNEMIKLIQKNHRVADKWTILAHSLGLSRHIMDIRIRVNMCGEVNSMCIVYLLQEWVGASSKKATLGCLLEVLREQEFNDIADELEEKYA